MVVITLIIKYFKETLEKFLSINQTEICANEQA